METITLEAKSRDIKVSPMFLRKNRRIPAVFYGHKENSLTVDVDYQEFRKAFKKAGSNQVVELVIDGKKKPVLIHEVQYNPLTDNVDHIDFLHVNMNEEITANIPVVLTGIAPAVKNFGGILTTLKHEVEVRCLPTHLPQSIEVDVSTLEQLHSAVHVKDLKLSAQVKVHGSPDDVVVTVVAPKLVEEDALPQAPTEEAAPAVGAPAAPAAEKAPEAEKKA